MFKLTRFGRVQRLSDGAHLPAEFVGGRLVEHDPHSPFMQELREWIAAGNTPQAADPEPTPPAAKDIVDLISELPPERRAALRAELAKG